MLLFRLIERPYLRALLQNNLMPNGEANVTGNIFEILHADRHSAGHYRCSADNRVGAADTREIFVNVLCKELSSLNIAKFVIQIFHFLCQSRPKLKLNALLFTRALVMKRN